MVSVDLEGRIECSSGSGGLNLYSSECRGLIVYSRGSRGFNVFSRGSRGSKVGLCGFCA